MTEMKILNEKNFFFSLFIAWQFIHSFIQWHDDNKSFSLLDDNLFFCLSLNYYYQKNMCFFFFEKKTKMFLSFLFWFCFVWETKMHSNVFCRFVLFLSVLHMLCYILMYIFFLLVFVYFFWFWLKFNHRTSIKDNNTTKRSIRYIWSCCNIHMFSNRYTTTTDWMA